MMRRERKSESRLYQERERGESIGKERAETMLEYSHCQEKEKSWLERTGPVGSQGMVDGLREWIRWRICYHMRRGHEGGVVIR
jgi:hypothetical protein